MEADGRGAQPDRASACNGGSRSPPSLIELGQGFPHPHMATIVMAKQPSRTLNSQLMIVLSRIMCSDTMIMS